MARDISRRISLDRSPLIAWAEVCLLREPLISFRWRCALSQGSFFLDPEQRFIACLCNLALSASIVSIPARICWFSELNLSHASVSSRFRAPFYLREFSRVDLRYYYSRAIHAALCTHTFVVSACFSSSWRCRVLWLGEETHVFLRAFAADRRSVAFHHGTRRSRTSQPFTRLCRHCLLGDAMGSDSVLGPGRSRTGRSNILE